MSEAREGLTPEQYLAQVQDAADKGKPSGDWRTRLLITQEDKALQPPLVCGWLVDELLDAQAYTTGARNYWEYTWPEQTENEREAGIERTERRREKVLARLKLLQQDPLFPWEDEDFKRVFTGLTGQLSVSNWAQGQEAMADAEMFEGLSRELFRKVSAEEDYKTFSRWREDKGIV